MNFSFLYTFFNGPARKSQSVDLAHMTFLSVSAHLEWFAYTGPGRWRRRWAWAAAAGVTNPITILRH